MATLILLIGGLLGACSKAPKGTPSPTETTDTVRHPVKGVVRGLDLLQNAVIVEHEDIPGFMPSMTMPFTAKTPQEIAPFQVGDALAFDFVVTPEEAWMENVHQISREEVQLPGKPARASLATERAPRVREGDALPDFELTDQKNRKISAATFSGKPLLLTFIFTRCPVPNFCPKISGNFESLASQMTQDPALANQVRLLSISFDPEFDSPEVLDAYGKRFSADPEQWRFATGTPEEIEKLTQAFAVYTKADKGSIDHGLCTALVTPDGTIQNIWRGNGWQSEEVLAAIKALPQNQPESAEKHDPSQSGTKANLTQSNYENQSKPDES